MAEATILRDTQPEDIEFLFQLYCDVRGPEVNAWGWPASQREAFLRMQFDAQRRSYAAAYPHAQDSIVMLDGIPIGRRLVTETLGGMHLIDIALLSAYRNRGVGSALIQQLLDACDRGDCALHLQVIRGNPAVRLYQRAGFREIVSDAMYIQMQRTPGASWTA